MARHYTEPTAPTSRSLTLATSSTPTRSSLSFSPNSNSKSPGASPRSPLLLASSPTLSLNDDPSLDLDFDLLFLHDDAPQRPKLNRPQSSFTEQWDSRPTSTSPRRPPTRRDWSNFSFSHYKSETGHGGAVGLRGKGRVGEMYTRNQVERGR